MKVTVGKAPWYAGVKEKTPLGRNRGVLRAGDYEWDLTSGWRPPRGRGWVGRGKKSLVDGRPMVRKVERVRPDGTTGWVYETEGYDEYQGFSASDDPDLVALAQAAFDTDRAELPTGEKVWRSEGCGHIADVEYAERAKVLRVTFGNGGGVYVFGGVPTMVAGELLALAKSKATSGTYVKGGAVRSRHLLGVRFWTLIRRRGTRRMCRYPFTVQRRNDYRLTSSNERHMVRLTRDMADLLTRGNPGLEYTAKGALKPGDEVTSILTGEELGRYADIYSMMGELSELRAQEEASRPRHRMFERRRGFRDKDGGGGELEVADADADYGFEDRLNDSIEGEARRKRIRALEGLVNRLAREVAGSNYDTYTELLSQVRAANEGGRAARLEGLRGAMERAVAERREADPEEYLRVSESDRLADYKRYNEGLSIVDPVTNKLVPASRYLDMRRGGFAGENGSPESNFGMKASAGNVPRTGLGDVVRRNVAERLRNARAGGRLGDEAFAAIQEGEVRKAHDTGMRLRGGRVAARYAGLVWTEDDIRRAAESGGMEKDHAETVRRFLRAGDARGALDYMKNTRRNVYRGGTLLGSFPYATSEDTFAGGE